MNPIEIEYCWIADMAAILDIVAQCESKWLYGSPESLVAHQMAGGKISQRWLVRPLTQHHTDPLPTNFTVGSNT